MIYRFLNVLVFLVLAAALCGVRCLWEVPVLSQVPASEMMQRLCFTNEMRRVNY